MRACWRFRCGHHYDSKGLMTDAQAKKIMSAVKCWHISVRVLRGDIKVSRIGRKPIEIPKGVTVTVKQDGSVAVKVPRVN